MAQLINRVGETFTSKVFGVIKIVEYFTNRNCTIQFEDGTIVKNIQYGHLKDDQIKNPNTPNIHGVGFIGQGNYTSWKEHLRIYKTWVGVLDRCYSTRLHEIHPTYIGCTADPNWHNYQVFAKWYEENFKHHMGSWHLDKDILQKGNKIYSPETCCFVPSQINTLFTKGKSVRGAYPIGVGINKSNKFHARISRDSKTRIHLGTFDTSGEAFQAYKTAKEDYIKEVAELWKDSISENTYKALYNYKVEITD